MELYCVISLAGSEMLSVMAAKTSSCRVAVIFFNSDSITFNNGIIMGNYIAAEG